MSSNSNKIFVIVNKHNNNQNVKDKLHEEYGFFETYEEANDVLLRLQVYVNQFQITELQVTRYAEYMYKPIVNILAYQYTYKDSVIEYGGFKYCKLSELNLILSPSPDFYTEVFVNPDGISSEEGLELARKILYENIIIEKYYTVSYNNSTCELYIDVLDINNQNCYYYNRIYNDSKLLALVDTNDFSIFIPWFEADDKTLEANYKNILNANTEILDELKKIKEANQKSIAELNY